MLQAVIAIEVTGFSMSAWMMFPPCSSGGRDEAVTDAEIFGALLAADTARVLMLELHQAPVLLGRIVGVRHGEIGAEAQDIFPASLKA